MASHYNRKDSPFYWIRFRKPDGEWGSKSSGVKRSTRGGLKKVRTICDQLTAREQEDKDSGNGALFSEWVLSWIDYNYDNENTACRYRNAWTHLTAFFELKKIIHPNEVTYHLCHEYMEWRTNTEKAEKDGRRSCVWNTAITELRALGAIEQEAVRRSYIMANPCSRLKLARRNTSEKREFTADEITIIEQKIKKKPQWMQETWLVAIKQGCRLSEVQVPMNQIDEGGGVLEFNVKGGKKHAAPIHGDLRSLIKKAKKEKREKLTTIPDNASKLFGQWLKLILDDEEVCFHCTRVTVATRLARAGYSETQTMKYVGHCSEMVHAIYLKLKAADVKHLGEAL